MKNTVLGAVVDANISMPLTGEIIPKIAEYAKTVEGLALDCQLRSILPCLNFLLLKFTQAEERLMRYTLSSIAVTSGTFSPI